MKQLLIGNAAVARGIYEAGAGVVSSYPGTPSTEITEVCAEYDEIYCEWAPNEKVAMESAFGASLAGVRSACAMKHVGLNVAADPLYTMSYTGVNAGLLICVADDPGMHSSQNEQDSRHHAIAAKVPMLEPSDSAECYEFAKKAFELSEKYDTPVMLRTCTRIAHTQSTVEFGERQELPRRPYVKNGNKYIMMPAMAKQRHPIVEARTAALTEFAETCSFNREEMGGTDIGIITSGSSYQYVKEIFGSSVSVYKLGLVNPLPVKALQAFAEKVKRVYVVEELDGIIEAHCKANGIAVTGKDLFSPIGEFTQATIARAFGLPEKETFKINTAVPNRPPMMCSGCPHRGMYYVLSKNKVNVLGDIGCYTLGAQAPLAAIDTTLCMGASISGLHGFNKALGEDKSIKRACVIGDSTFMHSGMTGLVNVAYNNSNSLVIILDNSITGMTGHQQNPTTGYNIKGDPAAKVNLEELCHALGIQHVAVVDPYDLEQCEQTVKAYLELNEPAVIISRRPCVLLKYVKTNPPLKVNPDKCKGCKKCMTFGCPSISIRNKKAAIDNTLCVGCKVCTQLCAFGAIEE